MLWAVLPLLLPVLAAQTRLATPIISFDVAPEFSARGVQVITADDSKHAQLLSELLGASVASKLSSVNPGILIIKNGSPEGVLSITVRYVRKTIGGQLAVGTTTLRTSSPFSRVSATPSGTTVIHSPESFLTQLLAEARRGRFPQDAVLTAQVEMARQVFAPRYATASVSLDSIVFATGEVIGPDIYGIIEEAKTLLSEAVLLEEMLGNETLTDSEVKERLTQLRLKSQPDSITLQTHAVRSRYRLASLFLAMIQSGALRTDLRRQASSLREEFASQQLHR